MGTRSYKLTLGMMDELSPRGAAENAPAAEWTEELEQGMDALALEQMQTYANLLVTWASVQQAHDGEGG